MREAIDYSRFDTPAHQAAQKACHHVIVCAVDGATRARVDGFLDAARAAGDVFGTMMCIAHLSGPCCRPPAEPTDGNGAGPGPA